MKKRLICRIANGLGNQMFLYASAYSISKKLERKLELDIYSGIENLNKKNLKKKFKHFKPKFELQIFNITSDIVPRNECFVGFFRKLLRKFYMKLDNIIKKKKFIIEHSNVNKITYFKNNFDNSKLDNTVYFEGYFESEKYFLPYKEELRNEFSFKNKIRCLEKFEQPILKTNSISMSIRADRFNETLNDDDDKLKIKKSLSHEKKQFDFILRAIKFFKNNVDNPNFFVFSDNPKKISHFFNELNDITVIDEFKENKINEDFFLMTKCKHFAVGPTSFHFWPAWLNNNENSLIVRPKNINVSNNTDYWPDRWVSI